MEETRKMRRVRKEIIIGKRGGTSDILNGKKKAGNLVAENAWDRS